MKTKPQLKVAIAAIAVFVAIAASSYALVPVAWSNASADNTWENAVNWIPALEPTNNTFDVEIGLLSTAPCNLSNAFEIDALTLSSSAAHLNLIPGALLAFTNTVTNNGTIVVNTTGANTTTSLRFDTSLLITGSGNIMLNGFGSGFNVADFNLNSQTVTIGINQTLHGHGTILGNSGVLINNGTINGDDASGNNMQVDLVNNASFVNQNNGFMKATNGGVLGLYSGLVDQTGGGTFLADGANSIVQLGGGGFAIVVGGILNTLNNGLIEANGAGVALVSVTNNGAFLIPSGNIAVIGGSYGAFGSGTGLTNNGRVTVGDGTLVNTTKVRFDSSGTLGGTGDVLLKGVTTSFNIADLDLNSSTVTIGANQTLHGLGTVLGNSGILINNGLIEADDNTGTMQLDLVNNASFVNQNNATIKAISGGLLGLYSGLVDQTGGGTFLADGANSIVQLGGGGFAIVIGGILNTLNNGLIEANGAGVALVSVTNNGAFLIPSGNIAVIGGSYGAFGSGTGLTNNGRVTVGDGTLVNTTKVRFDSSGTLGGTGDVLLKGVTTSFNIADLDLNSSTVTIGANQTLHGLGTVLGNSGILINNGLIEADDNTGTMQLDLVNNASFVNQNNATIKAISGGLLGLYSGLVDQTGGGTFLADGANSIVQLGGGGVAIVVGGILNTANNGIIQVTPGGAGVVLTSVTNDGTVQIPGGEIIVVTGNGLTNNGTVLVDTNADNTTTKIRFDANGTLGGTGSVTLNGILGSFNVADLDCNGHAVINDVNHTIKGNGDILMNGGTLTNNGTITPGLSPGRLEYSGTLNLGSSSNLLFEIAGTTQGSTYDWLNKIDNAGQTLGGNLVVRLINNFIPASSDTFTILTTQTTLAGAFSNVASGGHLVTADGHGMFTVTYSGQNNVVLSQFVPTAPTSKIVTLSTRAQAEDNRQVITTSFVIGGTDPTTVLVRALGSSLGLSPYLQTPTIQVQDRNGRTVAANDDWKALQQAQIQATGLAPTSDEESAVIVTIPPGSYTATLRGETKGNIGVAKFDIHDLSPNANSKFNSMSGLGFLAGGQTVVGDFTIANPGSGGTGSFTVNTGGKVNVLIRVLGPSFGGLADPTVELDNANGTRIFFNDNWQDSQKSQIQATGMAPTNSNESAIVANLDPGDYIAVVRGKVTGTGRKAKPATGFVRVEVYQLQQQPNN